MTLGCLFPSASGNASSLRALTRVLGGILLQLFQALLFPAVLTRSPGGRRKLFGWNHYGLSTEHHQRWVLLRCWALCRSSWIFAICSFLPLRLNKTLPQRVRQTTGGCNITNQHCVMCRDTPAAINTEWASTTGAQKGIKLKAAF